MVRVRRDQYTYRFAPDVPPVARVRPGETVVFETYDASTGRIDLHRLHPVGRLAGNLYTHVHDIFEMKRPSAHYRG